MKTSVMEVHDMLSVLSVDGVEKRIGEVAGVESVTVNFAAGNATVRYDETRLDIADIRLDVRQSSYDAASSVGGGHEGHAPPAMPAPAAPKTPSAAPAATPATPKAVPDPTTSGARPPPAASGGDEPQNKPAPGKS